jgi:hypothetical protein
MTVIDTTPTAPAPMALAREALDQAAMVDDDSTRGQLAQTITTLERAVRELLAHADTTQPTVTEYGVLAWSKHLGKHHVDACDDYESALSTLDWTRRKVDAGALLVSRPVAVPGPVGKWRALSPDDAAVAFETAKAGSR